VYKRQPKHELSAKRFGCFEHKIIQPASPYLNGFADGLVIPVSRWTETRAEDLKDLPHITSLLESDGSGLGLLKDDAENALYMFNHLEYDIETLKLEYDRDVAKGDPINVPANYYPDDDPAQPPLNRWRAHGHLLYGNWITEIYRTSPFDIDAIGA